MKLLTYRRRPSAEIAKPSGARPVSTRKSSTAADRVDHGDLAAGLQRDEEVAAVRMEHRRAGEARVVVVDAQRRVFGPAAEVDA